MKELFGNYLVSEDGVIQSKMRKSKATGEGIIVKPFLDRDGYKRIALVNEEGVRKKYRLCRIVAMLYVENPENKPVVNHIDGDIKNDHYKNLEWVTISENTLHAIKLGLINLEGRRCPETGRFLSKSERSTTRA